MDTEALFDANESTTATDALYSPTPCDKDSISDHAGRPLIEAHLHNRDVAAVLARARSTEVREALQRGDALPGVRPRRLLVVETDAASGSRRGSNVHGYGIDSGWDQLYKEGWQWWLDQARL